MYKFSGELDEFSFIAGNFQELEFQVRDMETSEPVDLNDLNEIRWVLFRYGDVDNPLLSLKGVVSLTDPSIFRITIKTDYTKDLSGLFMHQPILIDGEGREFSPAQGLINIISRANRENSNIIV